MKEMPWWLEDPALQGLSLHPMFVPTLVIEPLCNEALQILDTIHINTVRLSKFMAAALDGLVTLLIPTKELSKDHAIQ
jgi:hypothetical protein